MDKSSKKILVIIDAQNDFVYGKLGNKVIKNAVNNIVKKLKDSADQYNSIFIIRDIHFDNYLDTLEGKKLPVKHCIYGTKGSYIVSDLWDTIKEIKNNGKFVRFINKHTFASNNLIDHLSAICNRNDEIEIVGVMTDICIVSNAICLRAALPNNIIKVDAKCCAGTNKYLHNAALKIMKSCQIDIINQQIKKEKKNKNDVIKEDNIKKEDTE